MGSSIVIEHIGKDFGDLSVDGMGFVLGGSYCLGLGTDIFAVIEYRGVTLIPMTERWFLGLVRFEQEVVPVIDLGLYAGSISSALSKNPSIMLIPNSTNQLVGFVVDEIIGLSGFQGAKNHLDELSIPRGLASYVVSKTEIEGISWLMLDLQGLATNINKQRVSVVKVGV